MPKKLLLVNKKDKVIGTETKEKCHDGRGILHRAFSILILNNKNQILLSRRSKFKKLWPLYWDNSCSSHPLKNESYEEAGQKRLKKELGFNNPLKLIDKFQYQAGYKNIGSENELCALLVGEYNEKKIKPDHKEIANWKWMDFSKLQKDMKKNPQKYTPWLKIGVKCLKKEILSNRENNEKLNSILTELTKNVEPVIKKILISGVDKKFQKVVSYQIVSGGKRLRPALAIICCRMLGGKIKDVLYAAAGIEILHNYTLIIDDIIDKSTLRRGKPTTWSKFGKSVAECAGVNYSAAIFQAANKSKAPVLLSELFAKTLKVLIGGEILDILFEKSGRNDEPYVVRNRYQRIKEKDYFEMIGKKTASLLQTSCEIGGICAGAKKNEIDALRKYGFNFGILFQITDDILDIFGKEEKFKKKIGKDIEEGKEGNIVILLTLKELNPADRNKLLKIMKKDKISKKDIKEAMILIKKTNSRQKAYQLGESFTKEAKKALRTLPQNKWNETLRILTGFTIKREE